MSKLTNHRTYNRKDVGCPGGQFMSVATASALPRDEVKFKGFYRFYSMQESYPDADLPMYTHQVVRVIGEVSVDPESEPLFRVQADDGVEFEAYEGELNGFYRDTGQFFEPIPE